MIARELAERTRNTCLVMDVIRSLAIQTNLLVFNAGIEAARTTNSGCVAAAAYKLRGRAQRSGDATRGVDKTIDSIRHGAR